MKYPAGRCIGWFLAVQQQLLACGFWHDVWSCTIVTFRFGAVSCRISIGRFSRTCSPPVASPCVTCSCSLARLGGMVCSRVLATIPSDVGALPGRQLRACTNSHAGERWRFDPVKVRNHGDVLVPLELSWSISSSLFVGYCSRCGTCGWRPRSSTLNFFNSCLVIDDALVDLRLGDTCERMRAGRVAHSYGRLGSGGDGVGIVAYGWWQAKTNFGAFVL